MSVIIRLQNLPWSANALDIRQFFQGLSIPDGGVHIVGGEMGDAFIAFSTDEDARRAMLLDRGKLKEVQIRLLLSSRAEMQKVIETARQQSLAMMQAALHQQQMQQQPIVSKMQQIPQPPVITPTSLNKILLQQQVQMNENAQQSYQSLAINDNSTDSRNSKDRDRNSDRRCRDRDRYDRSSRSRSKSREYHRSRSRERSTRQRRDSRSRSRDRYDHKRNRRSTSGDRGDHNGEKRIQKGWDRTVDNSDIASIGLDKIKSNLRKENDSMVKMNMAETVGSLGDTSMWSGSPTQPLFQTNLTKGYSTMNPLQNIPSNALNQFYNPLKKTQQHQQPHEHVRIQEQHQQPIFSSNMQISASKSLEQESKSSAIFPSYLKTNYGQTNTSALTTGDNVRSGAKSIAFMNPYTATLSLDPNKSDDSKSDSNNSTGVFGKTNESIRNELRLKERGANTENNAQRYQKKPLEINYDELVGHCIKITNMCPTTTYSELRKFFCGLYIANNGIKIINDSNGTRIGVAYIRFIKPESKPKAFARNGAMLKSSQIVIESVTEEEFDEAVDSFKPVRRFGRFDDERKDFFHSNRNRDESPPLRRNEDSTGSEKIPFNNLLLEDVPAFAKEQDIMKMFSSYTLTDIILTADDNNRKQLMCYVKFHRAEDAKQALEECGKHIIGHKKVFISPCSEERFDKAKERYSMQGLEAESEDKLMNNNDEKNKSLEKGQESNEVIEISVDNTNSNNDKIEDESGSTKKGLGEESPGNSRFFNLSSCQSATLGPTDPRKRSGRQGTRFSKPEDNQNITTYSLVKNCDYKSSKQDFMKFFSNAGIPPVRVEILLNSRNQPSGECICEFRSSKEAERALFQSNYYLGTRCVRIELISPQEVAKRLGDDFVDESNKNNLNNNSVASNEGCMNTSNDIGNMNQVGMANGLGKDMNQMNVNMMVNDFNPNMNFRGNPFGSNSPPCQGGFNENFNKFQLGPENPFRSVNSNHMTQQGGIMVAGSNNDRFNNNRNNRGGRGPRRSRFSDYEDKNTPPDNVSNVNMESSMGNAIGIVGNVNPNMRNTDDGTGMSQVLGDTSVDQFGQPGCVIGMENVPYKATIEDIMEFFKQFNIQPHNVIRRYNDDGTPTGDARVAFSSPMQARTALDCKRHQKISNRIIYLTII